MLSKYSLIPVALVALGGSELAAANTYDEGQWITTFTAGTGLVSRGTLGGRGSADIADLGVINPSFGGDAGSVQIDHLQFNDAFRPGPSFGIETGYMAQSNVEPFVRLSYSQMRGRNNEIGAVNSTAFDSPVPIRADFDDMNSWALDFGTRYFLSDTGTFRTFVAGYLGADRVDALHAHYTISGMPASPREEFLPQVTRFDAGVEGGLAWQVADQADLSLSVGAQYVDARREHTDAFAPLGIEDVRFTDQKWSLPVNLGVNFRF
ncbi:MAG TPA: hypothetical protein VJQ52_03705 [Steroidobacteraceae bacterium]|nr:hypothetical protein [Steroidobacteraceae bacterium]